MKLVSFTFQTVIRGAVIFFMCPDNLEESTRESKGYCMLLRHIASIFIKFVN
jgi:hypothetical protein